MINTKENTTFKKGINAAFILILCMLVFTALTGLAPQGILSFGVVVCFTFLLLIDKLYYGFPFVIFYNSFYGLALGASVFRIYSILILMDALLRATKKSTLKIKKLIPLSVFVIYLLLVMLPIQGVLWTLYLFVDVLCCFLVTSRIYNEEEAVIKNVFKVYVVVSIVSCFSGFLLNNYIGNEYTYFRFMGTFEDPNYIGFFFTIAIFALITLKLFNKGIRILLVVFFYAIMLSTLSITFIVVNIVLWCIYLVFMKKLKWWSVLVVAVVVTVVLFLYQYGLDNPDSYVIGDLAGRIEEKLASAASGDINDATTNRSGLSREHFEYYKSLPVHKILFGGIPVIAKYISPIFDAAAHNEYVDMLLNIGLIGSAILLGWFAHNVISHIKRYRCESTDKELFLVVGKVIWCLYAVTLTMFLDFRFLMFFLI